MSIGIPIKLLHEAETHTVTVELKTGEVYRGKLVEAEDNMNCQMEAVTMTARDGRVSNLEQVFLRGSQVRFIIVPDMLKNAPMFKRIDPTKGLLKGKGLGVGGGPGRGRGPPGMGPGRGRGGPGAPRGRGRSGPPTRR
mmetsp:Transcript_23004/g.39511  ORF Transcript_23004/g.39511 Transcript_23004/m.39511 type:complete len:138 (+) Transcript_23004:51-464(+)|eukprot:CAMPEP_0196660820 /NCGR_PEP_ID=MMETSP1086-20130531/41432_1 /TAXON_ID=77921 /ORGANISM="Cyanoptyche  gloeocystis , Strain SAG4.97" /LENGTH=137 /DNA_ID=CAMNT_0041995435 /DNA_START=31 /DNA_END=444 /DNA_ORIENTATION=+